MEQLRSGPSDSIVLTWHPETRLAVLTYEQPTDTRGQDISRMLDTLSAWVGTSGETFYFLNDVAPLTTLDTEWRTAWSSFFRTRRDICWIALYRLSPVFTIMADMYRIATGIRIGVFADESSARAWLCRKGARI